jgi:peptide chain release factor 2
MSAPTFWDNQERARKLIDETNLLKRAVQPVQAFMRRVEDAETLLQLVLESGVDNAPAEAAEAVAAIEALHKEIGELEIAGFLTGKHDRNTAIVTIKPGAGGTESCDWAEMLLRMYRRWAERRGFEVEIQDIEPGEMAGITRATFRLIGENAYGYIKAERGVHRLVRISPFDANKRRQTSFASLDVVAEVEDNDEVNIDDNDLRIDVFRAQGKGGQGVNTTDSAVRITHIPSGIVVQCQNGRSQLKNKESAMSVLRARLYEKMQDEKRAEMEKFYGEKGEIGWGNQIRSYIFMPYQLVKDLRTGVETSDVQGVMDGDIDPFIQGWLRAGGPRTRNKDINLEE